MAQLIILTLNLLNFLNGIIHLPFLEQSYGLPWLKITFAKFVWFSHFVQKLLAKELNMGNKSCRQINIYLAKLIKF